jgi:nucleoid-associated protein YgaU
VVIPKQPLPKGSRELSLSAQNSDGTFLQSDRNVVVLVPEQTKQKIAPGGTSKVLGALAVLVPREGKGATVVIQRPGPVRPAPSNLPANTTGKAGSAVSIDSVDYDDAGNVTISGNSAPRTPLSVYIDNKHAASGVSDQQGRWRVVPGGELPPGDYTLRVDKVGEGGKVLGRAETQFTRAKPAKNLPTKTVVSVEPGNSLWRIARRVYGTGMQYSVIFDANREQIRDPDLIYPGQVFFVPHVN